MKKICYVMCWLFVSAYACAQDVRTLRADEKPGVGTLEQLSWLAGYWKGAGMGADSEELWMPDSGGGMHGIFRLTDNGILQFTEYMVIDAKEGSLTIRLKHYGNGTKPWEAKDVWTEFKLIEINGQTAWFDGITYSRAGNVLVVKLQMKTGENVTVEEFRFTRTTL